MSRSDAFYEQVYQLVRKIPEGRVTTYGDIAKALCKEGAARQVGYALARSSSVSPPVPAHRVVNRMGVLTAKESFQTPWLMQELLVNEGIMIEDERVKDFELKRWRPSDG